MSAKFLQLLGFEDVPQDLIAPASEAAARAAWGDEHGMGMSSAQWESKVRTLSRERLVGAQEAVRAVLREEGGRIRQKAFKARQFIGGIVLLALLCGVGWYLQRTPSPSPTASSSPPAAPSAVETTPAASDNAERREEAGQLQAFRLRVRQALDAGSDTEEKIKLIEKAQRLLDDRLKDR